MASRNICSYMKKKTGKNNNNKKMEIEDVTEQEMGHQRNQRRNKKILRDK